MGTRDIANKVFKEIQDDFPNLSMESSVDLELMIPIQEGNKYQIIIMLTFDEMCFGVSSGLFCWYPITQTEMVVDFKEAIIGFMRGENRILEHFKGTWPHKALLQKPKDDGWATVNQWWQPSWPISFNRSQVVVMNK